MMAIDMTAQFAPVYWGTVALFGASVASIVILSISNEIEILRRQLVARVVRPVQPALIPAATANISAAS